MTKSPKLSLKRREFLKALTIAGSLSPMGLVSSCLKPKEFSGFDVYWLHLEGAPLRLGFDQWIDPYGYHKEIKPLTPQREYKTIGHKLSLPEVWFNKDDPSPLLENLISIRGLSTKSPHLKQCRHEWFSQDLLKTIHHKESTNNKARPFLTWSTTNERLSQAYRPLLGPKRETSQSGTGDNIFSQWRKSLKGEHSKLQVLISNHTNQGLYFENLSQISEDQLRSLMAFYRKLINDLEVFVLDLKKRDLFKKSVILITSDRARIPTSKTFPLQTESLWQGLNISLISGAARGPVVLGHISKEHPKYKESYPGTWGHGLSSWTPANVHQLLGDLCWSTRYTDNKNWVSDNPWMDIKPFHGLYIKEGLGQII